MCYLLQLIASYIYAVMQACVEESLGGYIQKSALSAPEIDEYIQASHWWVVQTNSSADNTI